MDSYYDFFSKYIMVWDCYYSSWNENMNLLVQINFLNLFLYSSIKIKTENFTGPN